MTDPQVAISLSEKAVAIGKRKVTMSSAGMTMSQNAGQTTSPETTELTEIWMKKLKFTRRRRKRPADFTELRAKMALPTELKDYSDEDLLKLEKKLLRKLDFRMTLPYALYFFTCIWTRSAIGSAKVGGLQPDIGISNHEYNTSIVIFYLSYTLVQLPSNLFLKRLKPSWYFPAVVMAWAALTVVSGFVVNYWTLLIVRFLIGLVQGPLFPGAFFQMTCWYRKEELPMRSAIMYNGVILAQAFDGIIAAPILRNMDGLLGIHAWQWLFVIEGAVTFLLGFLTFVFWILPDMPENTQWLSLEERKFAKWRMDTDALEEDRYEREEEHRNPWRSAWDAVKDMKTHLFTVLCMSISTSASFGSFFPAIMKSMLYGADSINEENPEENFEALRYVAYPYIAASVASMIIAWSVEKRGGRFIHLTSLMLISLVGSILVFTVQNFVPRYFGFFLLCVGLMSCYNLVSSWMSSSIPRPRDKRAAAVAIANFMGGGVTNFYSSYFFPDKDAPTYIPGGSAVAAAHVIFLLCGYFIYRRLKKQNRQLEEEEILENRGKGFRYVL